ncbi:MAG TPA: GTPase Era [Syntrophobacteria bacterium]|nr:GTPase Era [Syntrophobacteria bacterium]
MIQGEFKSGFVSIIGAPNVGKSTLLNHLVGQKVAIVSPKPQTTRTRILAVRTTAAYQIILLDTPGIHRARGGLNLAMVRAALATLNTVDVVLLVVEAPDSNNLNNISVFEALHTTRTHVLLVVNKIDLVRPDTVDDVVRSLESRHQFKGTVKISALHGSGIDELVTRLVALLPVGPAYYPSDTLTDLPERFICGELIREKILHLTAEEIPYATAVTVSSFREDPEKNLIHIQADIHVERSSQKAIIIGKGGAMLRQIGQQARLEMENLLGARVFLELWVRVQKKWRQDPRALREFGYQ